MKSSSRVAALALMTVAHFAAMPAGAQQGDSLTRVKSEGALASASTAPAAADTTPKKKGGMFGRLKGVAHNKTVQSITKAAVCQALPGGQYMMGAAEAAKNKTSIASGAANAGSCIPGMPGAAGGMGGLGGGKGALAGAAIGAASSIGGGVPGAPGAAGSMAGMMKIPGGKGVSGAATATATAQSLAAMQTAMAQMNSGSAAGVGTAPAVAGAGDAGTEASGQQMKLSGDVGSEIKKGKLVIKQIDWIHGVVNVSAPSSEGFMNLMQTAGQAMKAAGGRYRVDLYTDKKYTDQEIAALGMQRQLAVMSLLQAGGGLGEEVTAGKLGKDKEQRVEIVKVK
jgi:hypothetical protein